MKSSVHSVMVRAPYHLQVRGQINIKSKGKSEVWSLNKVGRWHRSQPCGTCTRGKKTAVTAFSIHYGSKFKNGYSCLRLSVTNIINTFFKSLSNRGSVGRVPIPDDDTHLHMAIQSGMVQGCTPASVGNVDAAQQGNDHFCALNSLIGCCHVEGGLPVLVPCIDISRVLNQYLHCFLQQKQSLQGSLTNAQSILIGCNMFHQTLELWRGKAFCPYRLAQDG